MSKGLFKVELSPKGKTYKGIVFVKSLIHDMTEAEYLKCFGNLDYYKECFPRNSRIKFMLRNIVICHVIKIGDFDTSILKYDNKMFVIVDGYNEIYWEYELYFYKDKLQKKYNRAKKLNYEFTLEEKEILATIEQAVHIADIPTRIKHKFNKIRIIETKQS